MPEFEDRARCDAPPEDVWKLLYDPGRFPDWWAGVGTVEPGQVGAYTMYPEGYPDFPMPQRLLVTGSGVTISCLVSDWSSSGGWRRSTTARPVSPCTSRSPRRRRAGSPRSRT